MAGPLALKRIVVGHVSWADANRTRSPMTRLTASRRRQRPQHVADACGLPLNEQTVHRQIKCASDVDGQHGYVKDVVVNCVLYREAVREISRW